MELLYLFLLSFALGFVAAIPIGGSQIEMAKRAITGHLRAASMVVLGSVSSDLIYGWIALYGIAPFMENPKVLGGFNIAGVGILWILAFLTLKESKKPHTVILESSRFHKKKWAYFTGFSLAFSNPPMILNWLVGVTLAKKLGLATPFSSAGKIVFLTGGAIGLGTYLLILASVLHRIKNFIPTKSLGKIYFWLGIALFLLSFVFVYSAARALL
jgi:threonine/homoserine/homoserine lactone efflux protein